MLKLKPTCENCDCELPPNSTSAMICSYECTFCKKCVEEILQNVCPNCGGGFVPRPIRPVKVWREGVSLVHQPASKEKIFNPVEPESHNDFAKDIREVAPELR